MATTPGTKRLAGLLLAVAGLLASAAAVRGGDGWLPLLPDQDFYDFQVFAPPNLQDYAIYPELNHGIFFQYDRLWWAYSPPDNQLTSTAGSATVVTFATDSFFVYSDKIWGNRYELGFLNEDGWGLMASGFDTSPTSQAISGGTQARLIRPNPAPIDPLTGLPPTDNDLAFNNYPYFVRQDTNITSTVKQSFETYGIEFDLIKRVHQRKTRNAFTWMVGPRYMNLQDRYGWSQTGSLTQVIIPNPAYTVNSVTINTGTNGAPTTTSTATTPFQSNSVLFEPWTGVISDYATINATNSLVGPQLGTRLESAAGRWKLAGEFRVAPTANFQSVHLKSSQASSTLASSIGTGLGIGAGPEQADANARLSAQVSGFNPVNKVWNTTVFSMVGEYRADLSWQMSKAITLRVAYNGMVLSNITRAAGYMRVDQSGLFTLNPHDRWQQVVFANGVNFGVEINR